MQPPEETIMRLANKTALITGGNSGIGLATARLFVAEGARVAITGRNQTTLEAAAKELGPNALAIVADATDIAATEKRRPAGGRKIRQARRGVRQCRHPRQYADRRHHARRI
jgi:NAD(P)-dependent dehydrogenase (short-subunit alcohol dehydrogenase family)